MNYTLNLEHAPLDVLFFIVPAVAGLCIYFLFKRQKNRGALVLKTALLGLLVFLAFQLNALYLSHDNRPVVALAIDTSVSMKLAGRSRQAAAFLERHKKELDSRFKTRLYAFGQNAVELSGPSKLDAVKFSRTTDINRSLRQIRQETGGSLAGIVLLSDGNHTGETLPGRWVSDLNAPVFTVPPGAGKTVKDLAVRSVRVSDFAFKDTPIEITATVTAMGLRGQTATIALKSDGSGGGALTERAVTFSSENESADVTLRFTPHRDGMARYTVEAYSVPGEITAANNKRTFSLETVKEKIRILYLCGQPGPEYSAIRHALKNDPLVELVSFVILRNPENITLVPDEGLSLIPFPVHELFTRDLSTFDVLILENFTHHRFGFVPEYLSNISRWVTEQGGGVLMIGGDNAFGKGGWGNTPVADILPVTLEPQYENYEEGSFKVQQAETHHPITMLDDDPSKNRALWENLPELDGCQKLQKRKGADTILVHPGQWAVLAAWQRGKGHAAALGSNTTWRWALQSQTPEQYVKFWKNMVRYLAGMVETRKLRIAFDRPKYFAGEAFTLKLRLSENHPSVSATVYMFDPSGRRSLLPMTSQGAKSWAGQGAFAQDGTYRFQVNVFKGGTPLLQEYATQSVEPSLFLEETNLGINDELLRDIAANSGGAYIQTRDFSVEKLTDKLKKTDMHAVRERIPLWLSPWLLAAAIALLFAEWIFRKRKGLY